MLTRLNNVIYTPKIIAGLKKGVKGMPRSEGVEWIAKRLGKSIRQARDVMRRFVENNETPQPQISRYAAAAMVPARKIRRLSWDIETSPNIVTSWRVGYKINLTPDNIIKERGIICIGYKWEDEDKVHILHWDKNQDDKAMLQAFLKVANEADELIHHNGDSFDLPWFRTRCLFHGLEPLPQYKTADTLQWARRHFYFNSNKLDYIARFLGIGGKMKTEYGLWKAVVLEKCPKAMARMLEYCQKDVVLLEKVWKRLSKTVTPKTHAGVLGGLEKWTNPHTGSTNVRRNKIMVSAGGTIRYQMQDNDTGIYFTIGHAAHEAYLAAKTTKS